MKTEHRDIPGLHAESGSGTAEDPYLGQRKKAGVTYDLAWWWGDPENQVGFNSKVLGAQAKPKEPKVSKRSKRAKSTEEAKDGQKS